MLRYLSSPIVHWPLSFSGNPNFLCVIFSGPHSIFRCYKSLTNASTWCNGTECWPLCCQCSQRVRIRDAHVRLVVTWHSTFRPITAPWMVHQQEDAGNHARWSKEMVTQTTTEGRLEYPVILKPSCQKFSCPNIFLDFLFDNFSIFINLCKTGQLDGIDIKPCRICEFHQVTKS